MKPYAILAAAFALIAAPAAAQTDGNAAAAGPQVIRTKWSLDQPPKRRGMAAVKAKPKQKAAQSTKLGPAVPPPKVQRLPKQRVAARSTAGQPRKERVNAGPALANILRERERDRNRN